MNINKVLDEVVIEAGDKLILWADPDVVSVSRHALPMTLKEYVIMYNDALQVRKALNKMIEEAEDVIRVHVPQLLEGDA